MSILGNLLMAGYQALTGHNIRKVNGYEIRHGADLYKANLAGADLKGANLYGANLKGTDFRGANLYRANLYRAELSGADISGADLRRAFPYGVGVGRAFSHEARRWGINLEEEYLRLGYLETKLEGIIYDEETKYDTYSILDDHVRKDKCGEEK